MPKKMPTTSAENLEKRTVALPPQQWDACEDIATNTGDKLSEVYRRVMALGISAERDRLGADLSYRNKAMINQRLEAKLSGALEALESLEKSANTDAEMEFCKRMRAYLVE
jgi:hypothetical protein